MHGRALESWYAGHPLLRDLVALRETTWFNPALAPTAVALDDVGPTTADVAAAGARLARFAPCLARVFPQTADRGGLIESDVQPVPELQRVLAERYGADLPGTLWLKRDDALPVAGSIKARGGIYEVLKHAEDLALGAGLIRPDGDYGALDSDRARTFFGRHRIAVGSTGNLGLSIGIMGAALGFQVSVHMSADARQWKKDLLRGHGVDVIEYANDYGAAVAAGRQQALGDPTCHFVDDENSVDLFLGYAVAGERLRQQFAAAGVVVDARHPLFVYLPCGIGGAPGGVAFGLKLAFGDAVHCFFAEPTHAPCMFLGMYTGLHDAVAVADLGIDPHTVADGLAVGRPSGFVGKAMRRLVDGCYTVRDEELLALLALVRDAEGVCLEPSALAGVPGIARVLGGQHDDRARPGLDPETLARATHVAWATGGSMVPTDEMQTYLEAGRRVLSSPPPTVSSLTDRVG